MGMEVRLALSIQEYRHSNKSYNTPCKNKHYKDIFSNYILELAQSLRPKSFAARQSMNFVRKREIRGISGFISLAAYPWNRILRPPGIGLPRVGWYKAHLEIRSPWGRRRQWPRNLICVALTNWGPIPGTTSLLQCGFFNVQQNSYMSKNCETGPTG